MNNILLQESKMLDFSSPVIRSLIINRGWNKLDEFNKIKEIYNFVRDEIKFGYNVDDSVSASKVLKDSYGQCNTKGTLFMALLRSVGIPCRVHGFTIDKKLQKGAMTGFVYKNAPKDIFHSWVEVLYQGNWYELEAFILDSNYLTKLQKLNPDCKGSFCGYGVAVSDFINPVIDWNVNNTYIQSEGITQDFGKMDKRRFLMFLHILGKQKLLFFHQFLLCCPFLVFFEKERLFRIGLIRRFRYLFLSS